MLKDPMMNDLQRTWEWENESEEEEGEEDDVQRQLLSPKPSWPKNFASKPT